MRKNVPNQRFALFLFMAIMLSMNGFSQPFAPVAIGGLNHDVIAEAGTSSLTTTTIPMDGVGVSNKVIYTTTFRTLNGFGGGGIPDNGLITDAAGSYQLADYTTNNALLIQRNQTGDITINTPAQFDHLRILSLTTEGTSLLNITLFFTDGTSTTALTNYSLGDWFNNTANLVLSGFGRCTRATPASGADAFPSNPRMYYIDIPISCTDRIKSLQRINIANVTTAGNNAPYPNAIFFAVSATSYSINVSDVNITNATCTAGGSATINITGSAAPFNVSWNTVPVQNGLTVSNLSPGTYTATITDINGCISTHDVIIGLDDNLTLTAPAPASICFGASFNANIISNATGYAWTPVSGVSNPSISNPVLSPTTSTTYTITCTLGTCSTTGTLPLTVANEITFTSPGTGTICENGSTSPNITSNASGFSWVPTTGVSDPSIANPVLSPTSSTNYTITATTGACSVTGNYNLVVAPAVIVNAGSNVTIVSGQTTVLQGVSDPGTYLWTPATGLSATNILNPVASPSATTTYTLTITNSLGCTGTNSVEVQVVPECAKPMNAITPNGDGINDKWLVSFGNCLNVASVKVYNRYGSPVFESENYQNNWEGTYKGKNLPDGTYYYVILFKLNTGRTFSLKGDLTILR